MALAAVVTGGTIVIGDPTAPAYTIPFVPDAGTITQSLLQGIAGLVGGSTTVLSFGNVSKASMLWIKGKDSSGEPKKFKLLLNGSITIPEVTEMLLTSKTPTTGFTAASVINDVGSSAALDISYSVAG